MINQQLQNNLTETLKRIKDNQNCIVCCEGKERSGMSQCSISAYELVNKNLGERQALVLNAIHKLNRQGVFPSDKQISLFLKLPINIITPRRNELEKKNRIFCKSVDHDGLGNIKVSLWAIRGGYR